MDPVQHADLQTDGVYRMTATRDRRRRLQLAVAARRRLTDRRTGRVWINGGEVGGADARYRHLARTHD